MKKFLSILFCLGFTINMVMAEEDYIMPLAMYHGDCIRRGTNCEKIEPMIMKGLNYYGPKRHGSYEYRKKYCTVLGGAMSYYGTIDMKKAMEYNIKIQTECVGMF